MRFRILGLALLLMGCAADPDALQTSTGQILGKPNWVKIEAEKSRLVLPDYLYEVLGHEKTDMRDRYIEYVDMSNGYLKLENAYGGGFAEPTSAHQFRLMFDGINFNKEPIVTETWNVKYSGRLMFAEFMHADLLCVAMTKTLGKPLPMAASARAINEGYVKSVLCDLDESDRFTDRALDFGKQVKMRKYSAGPPKHLMPDRLNKRAGNQ